MSPGARYHAKCFPVCISVNPPTVLFNIAIIFCVLWSLRLGEVQSLVQSHRSISHVFWLQNPGSLTRLSIRQRQQMAAQARHRINAGGGLLSLQVEGITKNLYFCRVPEWVRRKDGSRRNPKRSPPCEWENNDIPPNSQEAPRKEQVWFSHDDPER